jgi:hypothetical protein
MGSRHQATVRDKSLTAHFSLTVHTSKQAYAYCVWFPVSFISPICHPECSEGSLRFFVVWHVKGCLLRMTIENGIPSPNFGAGQVQYRPCQFCSNLIFDLAAKLRIPYLVLTIIN